MTSRIRDRKQLQSSKGFTPLPKPRSLDVCAKCKGTLRAVEPEQAKPEYAHGFSATACPAEKKPFPRYVERLRKKSRRNMKRLGLRQAVKS